MSDQAKTEDKDDRPGWFSRAFWKVVNIALVIAIFGNAAVISIYVFMLAKNRIQEPLFGLLERRAETPVPPKAEYGYLVEPLVVAGLSGNEELYGLRRKNAYGGVVQQRQKGMLVNVLFVDEHSNVNRWMFKGTERAILWAESVLARAGDQEEPSILRAPTVVGLAMLVAEQDTDKDGEIGVGDRVTLYVDRLNGKPPEKVLTADQITVNLVMKETKIFYRDGSKSFVATYAIPDFKLLVREPIAEMPRLVQQITPDYDPLDD